MKREVMSRRSLFGRIGRVSLALVPAAIGFGQVAEAAGRSQPWYYAGLDWVRNNAWLRRWGSIASQRIRNIRTNWKRIVLQKALAGALGGAVASEVKSYLEREGMFCPEKPWWLFLGPYEVAWVVITCAHHAE